jgi:hypothetical protein
MTAVPQDPEPDETPADDTCYCGRCRWIDGCNAEGALNNKDEPPPA